MDWIKYGLTNAVKLACILPRAKCKIIAKLLDEVFVHGIRNNQCRGKR